MDEYVKEVHKVSKLPQYHCKLESCTERFGTQIESFRHLRNDHRSLLRYRCKKCKNSFFTVEELFRHHKIHDKNHLPFEAKWSCSRCGEIFDNLTQLMEHTRIHTENSYECDECNWRFTLISELTIHVREFHDTREHACHWCTRYFQTPELLLQHRNREHNFECSMCNNAFPSEDQLTAHQVVKHGKRITEADERRERMKESQEKRDKKRDQRYKRKEAARTPATFSCDQCVNFFFSQKDLDDHTCKYHIFICQICQHVSKTLPELDFHKDIMYDTTPRKLPVIHPEDEEMVCDWRHKTMVEDQQKELDRWREVKDMAAREKWAEYWAAWAAQKSLDEEKERRGNMTQRRKLKQQLEMTKTEIQTMYSRKKAAARIRSMNLQERSSREPTRKEKTEEKKPKKTLMYVFSFSTVFVAILTNCFIIFSSVSEIVFANHVVFLPYRNCK